MFTKLAQENLRADAIVALGDFEERVKKSVSGNDTTVALLGNTSKHAASSGRELTDKVMDLSDKSGNRQILVVGTVNIHTKQSENILEHIAEVTKTNMLQTNLPIYNPSQRLRSQLDKIITKIDSSTAVNVKALPKEHGSPS
jgi:proteasome assembly chaperone (PAC2) family protein